MAEANRISKGLTGGKAEVHSSEAHYSSFKSIKSFGWSEKVFCRKKGLDTQFGF